MHEYVRICYTGGQACSCRVLPNSAKQDLLGAHVHCCLVLEVPVTKTCTTGTGSDLVQAEDMLRRMCPC